ncbi:MAG: 4-phosphoerythronate dehydrogenase [Alcanivoracaceae bacterium]|nr:4-phosphoerythronate dehydrogenase [Alcanivoracaceae bacterium]
MKIVADENMPDLDLFRRAGRVVMVPGRDLGARQVADAEVLLVRSVTRVDAALLAGSDVRWVGSATIGTDHLDLQWLAGAGIKVANAPGCNAAAVSEYVLQAALEWARGQERLLGACQVGIVGLGNVGRRTAALMQALGARVLVSDPPREARGELPEYGAWAPLSAVLDCDLVSLHVPLVTDGLWPTWHLLSGQTLAQMGAGQCLVNTSRGAVIDNHALLTRLAAPQPPATVLDVWENEPTPMPGLVQAVGRATPHIAGYSVEGKRRGTAMLWQQFCAWRGMLADVETVTAPAGEAGQGVNSEADLLALLRQRYDIREDDRSLRASLASTDAGAAFDALRRDHGPRHECSGLQLAGRAGPGFAEVLERLGVR